MQPTDLLLSAAEGDHADLPGLGVRYMIRSGDTGGRFALLEHTIPARGLAAPMHTHENEDEYSYIMSGRMGALIGEQVVEAGPGELVAKPRGIPHAFWNAGDEEVRLLELISPGAFDAYFSELSPLVTTEAPPDFEALAELRSRYRLTMDLGSIERLTERFGLRPA